jgi:hypothetical protein
VAALSEIVVPLIYGIKGNQSAEVLRGYKDDDLRQNGVMPDTSGVAGEVSGGYDACADLRNGKSPPALAQIIENESSLTPGQARQVVFDAGTLLCPDQGPKVIPYM